MFMSSILKAWYKLLTYHSFEKLHRGAESIQYTFSFLECENAYKWIALQYQNQDQVFMSNNISDGKYYYLKLKTKDSNCFVAFWYIFSSRMVGHSGFQEWYSL